MKRWWKRCNDFLLFMFVTLMTSPVWAEIPKPPDKDLANGSNDWIDVGGNLSYRILSITCVVLGVITLIAVAAGLVKAYNTVHDRQDYGHFFKMLIVGLVCAALAIGLIYGGYSIIPSSNN